ncbi:hypothetical protein DFA_03852 [Cavenderia fasciculata]|uniref:Pseudouridine synthase RsuA/RluA-like domain-containing protein n=1 Tax=Cavenderia fasciculata TaxID=261658 RepID=F4Q0K7_CACFS|nr:uncharacterized protein DFA_03852 [Cavenderia fasciculata]EGG18358.1 hypothetical protein DFA_03852 [Cavenderia fasciculata]|eukprot:XP_004366262.1 hypothetical protein DFA_03852 [Cavenderia fasciculata]
MIVDHKYIQPKVVMHNCDKPHGINVGPLIDNLKNNLSWMVRQQQQQSIDTPIYNPHRIDFPTRGLCLLVKKSDEIHRFNQLFKDRTIKKRYRVFIYENQNDKDKEIEKDGEEKEKLRVGRYIHYMKPSKSTIKQLSLDKVDGWHDCILDIISIGKMEIVWDIFSFELLF